MRLITVKLVHADGRIIKVNANEVPIWKTRGFNIPKEGKTSGGEERPVIDEEATADAGINAIHEANAAEPKAENKPESKADDSMNDIII